MSAHMEPTIRNSASSGEPYPGVNVCAAVVLTIAAPFISLIAALLMRQNQRNHARRQQLTTWAVGSGLWLALGAIILIAFVASVSSAGAGACKGGIDRMVPPSYSSGDGGNWTATYQCWNGGTTTRPANAAGLNTAP